MATKAREAVLGIRDDFFELGRVGVLLTVVFSWLGLFNTADWLLELCCHFRLQYAAVQILFIGGAAWWFSDRREKNATLSRTRQYLFFGELALATVSLLLNLFLIGQLYLPVAGKEADKGGAILRVLQYNVNSRNEQYGDVEQLVRRYNADIVALQEVSPSWATEMTQRLSDFPAKLCRARSDNFGVALFSKVPWKKCDVVVYGKAGVPSILADLEWDGLPLSVVCTHPLPPASLEYFEARNDQFVAMARARTSWRPSAVLLGDLNCTSWSQYFWDFCKSSDLLDSRQGFGVQPSWPRPALPLLIPLDHCLISPDLCVVKRSIGPDAGSDHLPVYIELSRRDRQR